MTGGDKRRQIRQSSIQLLAAARPSSIQLFNMIHAHTLLHCFTHSLATRPPVPSNFAQEKKTKKIFAKNNFFTLYSIINILKKRGKVQEENIFCAKTYSYANIQDIFCVRISFTCRIASGWWLADGFQGHDTGPRF